MHVSVLHPNLLNPNKRRTPKHSLEEAVSLANALDIEILHEAVIPLKKPNAGTLFGSGKLSELSQIFKSDDIDLVIIDGPLTPIQQRNLEKEWNLKV